MTSLPPPLPPADSKPHSKATMRTSVSSDSISKPPLPQRSRGLSLSKNYSPPQPTLPPRLPQRHATVSSGSQTAMPQFPHHPFPSSVPPSPRRMQRSSSQSVGSFQPLPPPTRTAIANGLVSPPRRKIPSSTSGDFSSSDDDDDDGIELVQGFASSAKKLLEDYPDSTHANRRPPSFVPDIRLQPPHSIYSFATFGRHVCTAAHQVRVFDTEMGNTPIFTMELKDTGLDFRVKEPRVTALCFRPAAILADEGRYLWCGTKDGHLWELDIRQGLVTDTRPAMHSSAVVNIFRYKQYLLSLEEAGKLHVFEVIQTSLSTPSTQTVRITEKFTFAKMIGKQLWTASAPAVRSTTSANSKGPTIRVYEPCAPGAMPVGKTVIASEWTGAVTSATVLPLRPEEVYLGHEGGFVSVWSTEDLTCLQVLKISVSDILSLEGVGERLWAGNRKGQIHAWDVKEQPWQTTNLWIAHPFICWSCSRESVRAWDGLLAVEWIDSQMITRQPDYCTFRDIRLLVCSWNIDSAKPTDLAGSEANALFLEECLGSVESPDIVVFGFQEVIPLTDRKLTAKTILFGGKKDPTGGGERITLAYRQWLDKLQLAVKMSASPDVSYVKVHSENLVGLFTCVFVKSSNKDALRALDICTVKRGIGGIYGNKGAIIARLIIDDTSLCFINVHLAAGQSQRAARNADIAAIMEDRAILPASDELAFVGGGDGTGIMDHEMVILNGDMNYRIDQRRENVISSIHVGDFNYLLSHDQLRKEMRTNHSFRLRTFEEPPIRFAPTYKYDPNSDSYDTSEKRRVPAWCDRILHSKSTRIRNVSYRRYETTISDHRPISAGYVLTVKKVDVGKMKEVRREVGEDWVKKEVELLGKMSEALMGLV
ncbi:hypothetical protein TREMEDRAFT_45320 [Tremella mesenterica DSM 1558]|uniref:uncharacterized protein n=1 Tax=Tremella mesenterica (strain ATCC 24925 / CBS 8224 / DSM 1558 / NBRC 9311 / NRRL Y-6157 / RJB 2259-6 / UBC 559-6) TaxID=578456 RepID=UPI0003F495D3|nr:uncharacterized protein TREMEDRAFT_45320 [Tremella mesenterica DSM 1558]EIW67338.1 hypothetical protein TREMEDRAFT_45320 [Tremella mesenterica DSM 1558]